MDTRDKHFRFWRNWLVLVGAWGIFVGLALPFAAGIDWVAGAYNQHLAHNFFDSEALSPEMARYNLWVWAMLGAVIAAFGICILFLALYPFARREAWAWWTIALSLVVTFIYDVGVSIFFGFYAEVVFALTWFIPGIIPLLATRKAFFSRSQAL